MFNTFSKSVATHHHILWNRIQCLSPICPKLCGSIPYKLTIVSVFSSRGNYSASIPLAHIISLLPEILSPKSSYYSLSSCSAPIHPLRYILNITSCLLASLCGSREFRQWALDSTNLLIFTFISLSLNRFFGKQVQKKIYQVNKCIM